MTIACQSVTVAAAGITATAMTITPAATPCMPPCSLTVRVTWHNGSTGALTNDLSISVDGVIPSGGTVLAQTIGAGSDTTIDFTIVTSMTGSHTICPVPN